MRKSPLRRAVIPAELLLAALTAGVGSWNAGATLHVGADSGAAWMAAFAAVGVAGLAVVVRGTQTSSRQLRVAGLLIAALAPTVFLYPLNALLLLMAAGEATYAARRRPRAMA